MGFCVLAQEVLGMRVKDREGGCARMVPGLCPSQGWATSRMLWSYLDRSDCFSLELAGIGSNGLNDVGHGAQHKHTGGSLSLKGTFYFIFPFNLAFQSKTSVLIVHMALGLGCKS